MKTKQTLALLISSKREERGYTQKGLADRANVDTSVVENIEAGVELFLPASIRQKIAMALKINARSI
jgi:ribosome-binding protein aMBF1 (putative translation factor)